MNVRQRRLLPRAAGETLRCKQPSPPGLIMALGRAPKECVHFCRCTGSCAGARGLHRRAIASIAAITSSFLPLAPSEHFLVAETTAVSYIIYYSHTTPRPGLLQPTAVAGAGGWLARRVVGVCYQGCAANCLAGGSSNAADDR